MHIIKDIISHFSCEGEIKKNNSMNSGRINSTYCLEIGAEKYTLQKINKNVFKEPDKVMHNIMLVTEHLKNKVAAAGGDVAREVLNVVKATDGKPYYLDENGEYWRVYKYIDDSSTYDMTDDPVKLYNAGFGFGNFQKQLSDFDATSLYDTIPNFHNGIRRFADFKAALEKDALKRADTCREEIDFVLSHERTYKKLTEMQMSGEIPTRVTHNDTKVNNILIDNATNKALCVIDLDTVMPGLSVFDFGDAARFIANKASEEETDMSKVGIDLERYKNFASGFLAAAADGLTQTEKDFMTLGAITIGIELGMRFLGDYLNGDVYFKTERDAQNLDRARCQFTLVKSMEEHREEMEQIIKNVRGD